MTTPDDIDLLAAEYVLGTLAPGERAEVAARRGREAALERAITDWERRLGPLTEAGLPIDPPTHLFDAIQRRLDAAAAVPAPVSATAPDAAIIDLTRRLQRWRIAAAALGALAACLAVGFGLQATAPRTGPTSFVAILQKDAASPAFLVSVDIDRRSLTVRPVAAKAEPGKSYELWLVDAKIGAPKSLGVIGEGPFTIRPTLATYDRSVVENATYAVSLEPQGGSPTGQPTGPVLFTGHLVQATP